MKPEEAISAAFRAGCRGMVQGVKHSKAESFKVFLVQASDSAELTAKALAMIANCRPEATNDAQMAMLETHAFAQTFQLAVTALMLLGNFPYLEGVDASVIGEKFDG